jgi:hypothetical protein
MLLGHVLHMMVTPDSTEPMAPQIPEQDCRQLHPIAAAPQPFATHSTNSAPPTRWTQICPGWQVMSRQGTEEQGPVAMAHAPLLHVATVRPSAAQLS